MTTRSAGSGMHQEPGAHSSYEFGGFRLDARRRLLYSAGSSEPLPLAARAIDTLLYLVERSGELADRDELIKAVWPRVVVEDNNLERQISLLRRALREAPGENRFIATVPGRGYRFVAVVTRVVPAEVPSGPTADSAATSAASIETAPTPTAIASRPAHRHLMAALAAVAFSALVLTVLLFAERRAYHPAASIPSDARPSVAVMLCANLTGDPSWDVLVESIARDLIRLLGRNSGLSMPSAASSFAYQRRHVDTRQVARELNVTHVLECSLQPSQGGLRVAMELGDGATGKHVWSDSYHLRAGDIQNRQAMLAASLAQRVAPGMQAGPTSGLIPEPPTAERARALDYFVQANGIVGATETNLSKAHDLYTLAIEQDATFAPAFAARATTRLVQVSFGYVLVESVRDADRDAREAVKLDPSLPEARATLGMVQGVSGHWVQAEKEMEQAISLDNKNWQTFSRHALLLVTAGRLQDALKEAQKAHEELAPLAMPAMVRHAVVLSTLGEDEKAMRLLDSATLMGGVTTVGEIAAMQAMSAYRAGRPAEAANRLLRVLPPAARAAGADAVLAHVFEAAEAGKPPAMAQAAKELRALTHRLPVDELDWSHGQLLMLLYALVGDFDSAFDAAGYSLDYFGTADALGPWYYALWLPELTGLRRDDRFQALIERLHLPDYWNAYGPPDVPGCEWRDRKLRCS